MARSTLALTLGALLGSTALLMPLVAAADPAAATVPDASSVKPMSPTAPAGSASTSSAPGPAAAAQPATQPANHAPSSEEAMRAQRHADHAAYFSAHLAALHAGLALRADQQASWPPIETAIREVAKARGAMWKLHRRARADQDGGTDTQPGGADQLDALRSQGEALTTMGNAIQSLAKATAPLLAGLTPEQKNRLPVLIDGLKPRRLIARAFDVADASHEGMGHEGMGHEGMGHEGMGHEGMSHEGMGYEGMGHEGMGYEGMGSMERGSDRMGSMRQHAYGQERGRDGGVMFDRGHSRNEMSGGDMPEQSGRRAEGYDGDREGARGLQDGMSERHRDIQGDGGGE